MGKHAPVFESLEAVEYQHGGAGGRSTAGANIDEDRAQRTGYRVLGEAGSRHEMNGSGSQGSSHSRLQQLDFARVGIEPGAHSDGQSPLRIDVSDREAVGGGNAERLEAGGKHLVEAEGTVTP